MTDCNLCVHTNDGNYSHQHTEQSDFSVQSIGTHNLKDNTNALNNKVWDSDYTVYWQLDSEYEWLTNKEQIKLIKLAFLEASLLTPLKIRHKRRRSGDAQIRINWLGGKDEKYFKHKFGTLAYAYGPQVGIGGDITMNADHLWLLRKTKLTTEEAFTKGYIEKYDKAHPTNTIKFYDPVHTVKHEGGHALGMRHLTNPEYKGSQIMYPYYNANRVFGEYDRNYLISLYGQAGTISRINRLIQHKMGRF